MESEDIELDSPRRNFEIVDKKKFNTPRRFLNSEACRLMTSHEERIVRRMIAIYKALGIDGYVTFS